MIRLMSTLVLLGVATIAPAADDLKVAQLEQDVRDLQRQVQALSRQVDAQRAAQSAPTAQIGAARQSRDESPPGANPTWVDAAKWQRIRPGMSELDVLAILGPPTSMRMEGGARVLLYAMEIGASGFLGGSVRLENRSVASVQRPTLQ